MKSRVWLCFRGNEDQDEGETVWPPRSSSTIPSNIIIEDSSCARRIATRLIAERAPDRKGRERNSKSPKAWSRLIEPRVMRCFPNIPLVCTELPSFSRLRNYGVHILFRVSGRPLSFLLKKGTKIY